MVARKRAHVDLGMWWGDRPPQNISNFVIGPETTYWTLGISIVFVRDSLKTMFENKPLRA